MVELREDFIDGQITCPVCGQIFHERGQIGGSLRWVFSHGDCKGAGARVPLELLSDSGAKDECRQLHAFNEILSIL